MDSTYKSPAIVLKSRDYQENDKVYTLYTKYYGKLDVLGKGTKKIGSKLNPHLGVGNVTEVLLAKGKGFDRVAGAVLVQSFSNIQQSLESMYISSYLLEVFNYVIHEQEADGYIYNHLEKCLQVLDEWTGKISNEILLYVMNSFLLQIQVVLGDGVEEDRLLSGISKEARPYHEKLLEISLNYKTTELPKVKVDEKILKKYNLLAKLYLEYVTEREIKSFGVL